MTRTCRTLLNLCFLALGTAVVPAQASGNTFVTHIDGPLVIGDQLFSGGRLELVTLRPGQITAVRVDGQQVALLFEETVAHRDRTQYGKRFVVLQSDARGYQHLVALGYATKHPADRAFQPLRVAALSRGIASVPQLAAFAPAALDETQTAAH